MRRRTCGNRIDDHATAPTIGDTVWAMAFRSPSPPGKSFEVVRRPSLPGPQSRNHGKPISTCLDRFALSHPRGNKPSEWRRSSILKLEGSWSCQSIPLAGSGAPSACRGAAAGPADPNETVDVTGSRPSPGRGRFRALWPATRRPRPVHNLSRDEFSKKIRRRTAGFAKVKAFARHYGLSVVEGTRRDEWFVCRVRSRSLQTHSASSSRRLPRTRIVSWKNRRCSLAR